jgi:lipoprotein-releasing system permease protein
MKNQPIRFLAIRMLAGRKDPRGEKDLARRALLGAIASVAVSIIPLITVMQVADGMIGGITSRYVELGTYHAQLHSYGARNLESTRNALRRLPEVRGAWIETQTVGVVFANGRREGVAVRGVEPDFILDESTTSYLRLETGVLALERPNDALVGSAIASKLELKQGDILNLITVRNNQDGEPLPRVTILRVAGIVSAGYRELDSQWVFMRNDTARKLFPAQNSRSFVGIKLTAASGGQDAPTALPGYAIPPGQVLYSWKTLERNLFESLSSTRTMLLLIMAVTVIVAAINVSSALMTLVLERHQEIAVLKGLGAEPGDLAVIFSMGGAALGAVGALFGAMGGLLASTRVNELLHLIELVVNSIHFRVKPGQDSAGEYFRILDPEYYLEAIPVDVAFGEIAAVVGLTIAVSFLAALLPARKAASLSPLELFRRH